MLQPLELLDNKYRIEQLLGGGGMGTVYRAVHIGTKRTVAIKVIHPQLSRYEEFVERFRREAEAAGRLRHPNVVDVTDFGFAQTNNGPVAYLVMEFLDGCSLAAVLAEEKRLPLRWVVDILEQVCSAVDEAHRLGLIHRDLKPDNIWLEPNHRGGYSIKVLDFGLVKLSETELATPLLSPRASTSGETENTILFAQQESDTIIKPTSDEGKTHVFAGTGPNSTPSKPDSNGRLRNEFRITADECGHESRLTNELTRLGSVMGTPAYMSPEQCRSGPIDTRSDNYSLGVIAYQMLAGKTPFVGDQEELINQHLNARPPDLRERNRRVPRKLSRLIMSALEKDPSKRPQTAAGFGSAISASVESTGQLLRHAIALYSEHFPAFFKVALIGYAPLILILVASLVLDKFVSFENLATFWQSFVGLGLFASIIVANFVAYFAVSAATVPVVVQLMIAPLREIKLATIWSVLKRRWRMFVLVSVVVLVLILGGAILFVVPGAIAAVCLSLYAPVVIMEDHGVWATLRRAVKLASRSWASVLTITLLEFVLPIVVWRASITTSFTLKFHDDWSPKEFGFSFSSSNTSALFQLLNIFITPLTAIMISLLYLKTRHAGGESLSDAGERFEELEIPRSKWQSEMRRSTSATAKK